MIPDRRPFWRAVGAGPTALLLALVTVGTGTVPAQAQKLQRVPTPIEVDAAPDTVLAGSEVELRGSSVRLQELETVALTVEAPSGHRTELETDLDGAGRFSLRFVPSETGAHQVTATAPDGKARATTSFTVLRSAGFSRHALAAARRLVTSAEKDTSRLIEAVAQTPVSPPQQELLRQLEELRGHLREAPGELAKTAQAMASIDDFVEQYPETAPEFQPIYDGLGDLADQADPLAADLSDRVAQISLGVADCDRLDMAAEAVDLLGLAFSLLGKPAEVAVGLLVSRTWSTRVTSRIPGPKQAAGKLALDNLLKHSLDLSQGVKEWRKGAHGHATTVANFALQQAFGVYCEKFEGPFKGSFHLEYYEGRRRWLAYDVDLEGMLFLRYEKQGGTPTPVTGEFEGVAGFRNLREDYLVLESWARRFTVARWTQVPTLSGGSYLPEAGKLGRAALGLLGVDPGYFRVPVEGLLKGKNLALKFKDESAAQDYPDRAKGKVIYILVEPALPIPHVAKLDVTFQGAHYILSRATHKERGTSAEPFALQVRVDPQRKMSVIEETYSRVEENPGSLKLRWSLELKACNPGCPY